MGVQVKMLKKNLLVSKNLALLEEVQVQREAELQRCISYLSGGEGIGLTKRCVHYRN